MAIDQDEKPIRRERDSSVHTPIFRSSSHLAAVGDESCVLEEAILVFSTADAMHASRMKPILQLYALHHLARKTDEYDPA
jgi:hypothetical protein